MAFPCRSNPALPLPLEAGIHFGLLAVLNANAKPALCIPPDNDVLLPGKESLTNKA